MLFLNGQVHTYLIRNIKESLIIFIVNFVTKHLVRMHHSCFKSLQRFMSKYKVEFRLLQNMLLNAFNTKLRENSTRNCHTKLTILFHPTMLNALPVCKCSGHLAHYEQRTSSKCCTQMFTVKLRVLTPLVQKHMQAFSDCL